MPTETPAPSEDRSRSKSIRPWLIAIALVLPIVLIGGWVLHSVRQTQHRSECKAHLKQIALALHAYHDVHGSFPPAYVKGPDGEPWHSWRVLLLPYLGQEQLHARYNFDQPWDGPDNRPLATEAPAVYQCQVSSGANDRANYFAIVSRRSMWPAYQSVALADVMDGSSNTLQVVEDPRGDVIWTAPVDLTATEFRQRLPEHSPHGDDDSGGRHVVLADGAVRFLRGDLEEALIASLITPHYAHATFNGDDWPAGLDWTGDEQTFGPPRDVSELAGTMIVASNEEPLAGDQTSLWCATFQMAWDALQPQTTGGRIELDDPPAVAELLNDRTFPTSALSDECYALLSGGIDTQATTTMTNQLRAKFPTATPYLEVAQTTDPVLRFYAYLQKSMPFASDFDRLDDGLTFHTTNDTKRHVAAFGLLPVDKGSVGSPVRQGEVEILDYVNDERFVLQLKTDGPQSDHIVLARIEPAASLQACWELLQERIDEPHSGHDRRHLMSADSLMIPLLTFNLETHFQELLNKVVLNLPSLPDPTRIKAARQWMRFRLDETGADFISGAELMVIGENGHDPAPPGMPRQFHFHRPFLLALRESDDKPPYFLAWIANTELMQRQER
jgi:hypothetical protein